MSDDANMTVDCSKSEESFLKYQREINAEVRKDYRALLLISRVLYYVLLVSSVGFVSAVSLSVYYGIGENLNLTVKAIVSLLSGSFIGSVTAHIMHGKREDIAKFKSKLKYCIQCDGKGFIDTGKMLLSNPPKMQTKPCDVCQDGIDSVKKVRETS